MPVSKDKKQDEKTIWTGTVTFTVRVEGLGMGEALKALKSSIAVRPAPKTTISDPAVVLRVI